LEAAHWKSWRQGNRASDGILLRADLHALYDAGLLWFEGVGTEAVARIAPAAAACFGEWNGAAVTPPKTERLQGDINIWLAQR